MESYYAQQPKTSKFYDSDTDNENIDYNQQIACQGCGVDLQVKDKNQTGFIYPKFFKMALKAKQNKVHEMHELDHLAEA